MSIKLSKLWIKTAWYQRNRRW